MKLKLKHKSLEIYAEVDANDYKRLSKYGWTAQVAKNAIYGYRTDMGKKIYLHRDIMNPPEGYCVDHINHDCLDNRRKNLRIASYSSNQANRRLFLIPEAGYPGVYKSGKYKWRARIRIDGKIRDIGSYETAATAAVAFQMTHIQYHGEFSIYNRRA